MAYSTKKGWLILILAIVCSNISAQTIRKKFISSDGGFTINLPEQPDESGVLRDEQAYNLGAGKSFTWKENDASYQIQYIKIDTYEKPLTAKRKNEILDDMRNRAIKTLAEQNAANSEKSILLNDFPGKEIEANFPAGKMIFRIYLVDKKIYWLITAMRNPGDEPEVIDKLNSFKLLSKEEIIAQKLKETTIEPLPQKPSAKKSKSDVEDENLKGKVKSVVEFIQSDAKSKREIFSESHYDEQGNLVKVISYAKGYPESISVWGYIDGERVNNEQSVDYNGDEFELLGILKTSGIDNEPEKTRDVRYAYKFKYRYDEAGNMVEKWMYLNDGDLWLRYVYTLKDNRKETTAYDEDGKVNWKSIEILDKSGNVTEDIQYDYDGKISSKSVHTYKFDEHGNWIEQKDFEKTASRGKTSLKPSSASYRTITYYQ